MGAKWGEAQEWKKATGSFPYFWGQFLRSWGRVSFLNHRCLPSHRGLRYHHLCRAAPGLTQENKQKTKMEFLPLSLTCRVPLSTDHKGGPLVELFLSGTCLGLSAGSDSQESACNAGDLGSIPGSGRYSGEETGNLLQDSCLENPMDKEDWLATVHGVAVGHE